MSSNIVRPVTRTYVGVNLCSESSDIETLLMRLGQEKSTYLHIPAQVEWFSGENKLIPFGLLDWFEKNVASRMNEGEFVEFSSMYAVELNQRHYPIAVCGYASGPGRMKVECSEIGKNAAKLMSLTLDTEKINVFENGVETQRWIRAEDETGGRVWHLRMQKLISNSKWMCADGIEKKFHVPRDDYEFQRLIDNIFVEIQMVDFKEEMQRELKFTGGSTYSNVMVHSRGFVSEFGRRWLTGPTLDVSECREFALTYAQALKETYEVYTGSHFARMAEETVKNLEALLNRKRAEFAADPR